MVEQIEAVPLDRVFHALADPTRRDILGTLRGGEATVTALAEGFPVSLNAVSKHIKTLERAGLVRRRVVGREHRIGLDAAALDDAAAWIEEHRRFWNERLDALGRYLREGG